MAKRGFSLKKPMSRHDRRTALLGWGAGALVAAGAYVGVIALFPHAQSNPLVAAFSTPQVDSITTSSIGNGGMSVAASDVMQRQLDDLKAEMALLREALSATQVATTSTNRRVSDLESTMPDVTASIAPALGAPSAQPLPDMLSASEDDMAPRIVLPAPEIAGLQAVDGGSIQVTMRPLEVQLNADGEPVAAASAPAPLSQTPFAIDIGGADTLDAIDALWVERQRLFAGSLDGLAPRILLQTTSDGALDLRLVAGPIDDAADAAMLCAQLVAAGMDRCLPAIFDGQQLALR